MRRKFPLYLAALGLVLVDQLSKVLVRALLPLGERVTLIPHVVGLYHIRNTGAAFSSFSGGTVVLAAVSLAACVVIVLALWRNWLRHPAGQWILVVLLAGAFGNFIDRAFFGYVTDMVELLFVNFGIFNFADMCVTLGAIALAVYVIFFYNICEKRELGDAADREG